MTRLWGHLGRVTAGFSTLDRLSPCPARSVVLDAAYLPGLASVEKKEKFKRYEEKRRK